MNKRLAFSLLLMGLGIVCLGLSAIKFKSNREVLRVGDFSATAATARTIPAFRYVGFGSLAAGVIIWLVPKKR